MWKFLLENPDHNDWDLEPTKPPGRRILVLNFYSEVVHRRHSILLRAYDEVRRDDDMKPEDKKQHLAAIKDMCIELDDFHMELTYQLDAAGQRVFH